MYVPAHRYVWWDASILHLRIVAPGDKRMPAAKGLSAVGEQTGFGGLVMTEYAGVRSLRMKLRFSTRANRMATRELRPGFMT